MAYVRIDWVGKEDSSFVEGSSPAISAENLNNLQDGIEERILRSGDTMTGALKLYGEPTSDREAATKKYVDENIVYISGEYNLPVNKTVTIGTFPNFSPDKYIVSVASDELQTSDYYGISYPWLPMIVGKKTILGMRPGDHVDFTVTIDENGCITAYSRKGRSKCPLRFLFIPVKTATLIN